MVYVALLVAGVAALGWVADRFVIVSSRLARRFGVSALVVGVVVMGFGTSLPELLVSVQAAAAGEPAAALGNVVGSNVVNLTVVLGLGALVRPLVVRSGVARREAPVAVAATAGYALAVLWAASWSRLAGAALVVAGVAAVARQLRGADRGDVLAAEADEELEGEDPGGGDRPRGRLVVVAVALLAALVAAAQVLLVGAEGTARLVGLSEAATGVLLLAVGTSLPELASVLASARRGEHDLIAGNLWGSTLFNSLFVGGAALAAGPPPAVPLALVATPVVVAAAAWGLMAHRHPVGRGWGLALLAAGVLAFAAMLA